MVNNPYLLGGVGIGGISVDSHYNIYRYLYVHIIAVGAGGSSPIVKKNILVKLDHFLKESGKKNKIL